MPRTVTRQIRVERRTYLKGRFVGKLFGTLDAVNSDRIHENFFDLEFLSAEVFSTPTDIRKWQTGDEFEEFAGVDKFPSAIPSPLICNVDYEDGSKKRFNVSLRDPKFKELRLVKQLYEKEGMFVTLEGSICGYIQHFDAKEVEETIPDPSDIEQANSTHEIVSGNIPRPNSDINEAGSGPNIPTGPISASAVPIISTDTATSTKLISYPSDTRFRSAVERFYKSNYWSTLSTGAHKVARRYPHQAAWLAEHPLYQMGKGFISEYVNGQAKLTDGCATVFLTLFFVLILLYAALLFSLVIAIFLSLVAEIVVTAATGILGPAIIVLFLLFLQKRVRFRNKWIVKLLILFTLLLMLCAPL